MREITQGMLDRYWRRFHSLGWNRSSTAIPFGLGRRAELKALRDAMSLKRSELRRISRRIGK